MVEEHKTSKYANLRINQETRSKDRIEVCRQSRLAYLVIFLKPVKDCLQPLFRAWVTLGHSSGVEQMIKFVSWNSLVCLFSIFVARNHFVLTTPHLVG
jgi:hypothetical protein